MFCRGRIFFGILVQSTIFRNWKRTWPQYSREELVMKVKIFYYFFFKKKEERRVLWKIGLENLLQNSRKFENIRQQYIQLEEIWCIIEISSKMREILDIVKNTEKMEKMVWNRPVPVPSFSGLELTRTILSVPWRSPLPFKKKEVAVEKGENYF